MKEASTFYKNEPKVNKSWKFPTNDCVNDILSTAPLPKMIFDEEHSLKVNPSIAPAASRWTDFSLWDSKCETWHVCVRPRRRWCSLKCTRKWCAVSSSAFMEEHLSYCIFDVFPQHEPHAPQRASQHDIFPLSGEAYLNMMRATLKETVMVVRICDEKDAEAFTVQMWIPKRDKLSRLFHHPGPLALRSKTSDSKCKKVLPQLKS